LPFPPPGDYPDPGTLILKKKKKKFKKEKVRIGGREKRNLFIFQLKTVRFLKMFLLLGN